jgi:hypothetical protein
VYEPTQTITPVVVTTPSLSVGPDPTFSVDKIKRTVAEILADNIHAPITCQALINSAETAEFASTNTNGYHLLPVSGKKIHEHLSSGNMQIIKTQELDVSGNIRATGNLRLGNSSDNTIDDDNPRFISTAGQLVCYLGLSVPADSSGDGRASGEQLCTACPDPRHSDLHVEIQQAPFLQSKPSSLRESTLRTLR